MINPKKRLGVPWKSDNLQVFTTKVLTIINLSGQVTAKR